MSKGGPFNTVAGLKPRRHFFNLSHSKLFTLKCGELFPVLHMEVLPGDKFKIGNSIVIRMQPLYTPILQSLKVYTEYFFVPNRLLWEDWENFITGGKTGEWYGNIPRWNNNAMGSSITFSKDSLADAVGLPIGVAIPAAHVPNGLMQRAYNLIWNEYYRDETIDSEMPLNTNLLLKRRWKKDYFTSALPFQQRGTAPGLTFNGYVSMSFNDSFPVRYGSDLSVQNLTLGNYSSDIYDFEAGSYPSSSDDPSRSYRGLTVHQNSPTVNLTGKYVTTHTKSQADATGSISYPHQVSVGGLAQITNSSLGFDVSDLRKMVQIQKFLERNARAGYRLNEFLLAHFGLSPRDSVLQRPEYIGGSRSNVVVSEVLQTSQSTEGDDGSPQGNLAGRGISVSSEYISTYTFSEHGYLIGLCSIMPSNLYDSQGIGKEWLRRTRYDFYFPEFAHLSEQPIKTVEIFASHSGVTNETIFGYQPIYTEYRHMRSKVVRDFRVGQALDSWTMARSFVSAPTLSSEFLECDPPIDRVVAVNTFAPFMVNFGNIIKAFRPIPVLGEPGLVDHF